MKSHHQTKLRRLLEIAEDEHFFLLLWATHILQSDDPSPALKILQPGSFSQNSVGADVSWDYRIHPWELETLANLKLTTPTKFVRKGKRNVLAVPSFQYVTDCVNRLRKLENEETMPRGKEEDISWEMSKIGHRQFPWQRGFANAPDVYRNLFVYGQGACADYFEDTYGISIDRFFLTSFALYSSFLRYGSVTADNGIPGLGISKDEVDRTARLIALPVAEAKPKALREQRKATRVAYKPSILRQFPCVIFRENPLTFHAPLPDLIIDRISSGLFYDVIGYKGSGDEFGRRFEAYCLEYLQAMLEAFQWCGETSYGRKGFKRPTPDVLGFNGENVQFVFECKARRMPYEAMFKAGPTTTDGIADIGKGIRQIWTFFADCRKGLTEYSLDPDACGAILTMDNWNSMGVVDIDRFFEEAAKQIEAKGLDVSPEDRKPVQLIPIQSLERMLSEANPNSFFEAFALAKKEEFKGYSPENTHRKTESFDPTVAKPYPFDSRIIEFLPWWERILERYEKRLDAADR